MRRTIVVLGAVAVIAASAWVVNAGAIAQRGGATITQRLAELERRADRQQRAINTLRTENEQQQRAINRLLTFRTSTNRWRGTINGRTSKLRSKGVYVGPVDNGQLKVGAKPRNCEGQVAKWNANAKSLGCVRPS